MRGALKCHASRTLQEGDGAPAKLGCRPLPLGGRTARRRVKHKRLGYPLLPQLEQSLPSFLLVAELSMREREIHVITEEQGRERSNAHTELTQP